MFFRKYANRNWRSAEDTRKTKSLETQIRLGSIKHIQAMLERGFIVNRVHITQVRNRQPCLHHSGT